MNIKKNTETKTKSIKARISPFFVIEVLLISISLAILVILSISILNDKRKLIPDIPVMENKIREIQELAVVKQVYRDVIYTRSGNMLTSEVLFSIDFNVIAGIDLSHDVTLEKGADGVLQVTLPKPQILSIDAKDETIKQIYARETLRSIKQSDYMSLIIRDKTVLEKTALESGILEHSRINTEKILEKLFKLSGYDHIEFHYKEGTESLQQNKKEDQP